MAFVRYSKKEPLVFGWVMIPYILVMNMLILGSCIFNSALEFGKSFLGSGLYFLVIYFIFGLVAVFIRNRFPSAGDLFKRIAIMLPIFYLMNIGSMTALYLSYVYVPILDCGVKPNMFWWAVLCGCILSTVITFINEAIANWENWKASLAETEKLKNAYQRSRLLGLKGQINPHFLFNCFNTLSGLIPDDEEKAERFLDEMSLVHRYLLRSDDEFLIPVADEIKFAESYLYLTEQRFGAAIKATIRVDKDTLRKNLPPLSMQVILENIIYTNAISKKSPLKILIESNDNNEITITHSVYEKTVLQNFNIEEGLDNLLNKYQLLNAPPITISESSNIRIINLPLFGGREVAL
jgi:two-component system LytT family sensor kinase